MQQFVVRLYYPQPSTLHYKVLSCIMPLFNKGLTDLTQVRLDQDRNEFHPFKS